MKADSHSLKQYDLLRQYPICTNVVIFRNNDEEIIKKNIFISDNA